MKTSDSETLSLTHSARQLRLPNEAATRALGGRVADFLRPGDLVALNGDLAMGKTVLARGVIGAFFSDVTVPSPTFTLVQIYKTDKFPISHVDLYRLDKLEDVFELGLEEALDEGVVLMEWPERWGAYLPVDRLDITLSMPNAQSEMERMAYLSGSERWMDVIANV
ncbi:MAG: tRNA (adenosine(37)-N6)-threonylcarbamoyltransferase complex ATPase subunit type 1 TsaE [Parvularculales bacterium]